MSSSAANSKPLAVTVEIADDELRVQLADGRRLSVPLSWFPRLQNANPHQRSHFELLGGGVGIHWPDLDEDLSIAGLLRGALAPGGRATKI